MGLGEVAKAVIFVKSDVSDAKAKLRDLRGEERRRHQALIDEMDAQNKRIDGQIAFWGKMAIGIGGVVAAFKIAQNAAKAYLEDVRLESAAAGASLSGLQKATNGLVEADTLLAFAGKTMHGVWKLNQSEMEAVLRGAMALRKTMGVELQPTVEALTEAVTKGNTRALKEFGIEAKDKQGLLKALGASWRAVGGDASLAGDSMERAGVSLADAFDDIVGALGEIVMALAPVVKLIAEVAREVSGLVKMLSSWDGLWGRFKESAAKNSARFSDWFLGDLSTEDYFSGGSSDYLVNSVIAAQKRAAGNAVANAASAKEFNSALTKAGEDMASSVYRWMVSGAKKFAAGTESARRSSGGGYSLDAADLGDLSSADMGFGRPLVGAAFGAAGSGGVIPGAAFGDALYRQAGADVLEAMAKFQAQADYLTKDREDTILAQIFGTPAEIDEQVEAIKLASAAFDVFANAAGDAYDALVSGSGSAMDAFQKAIASGIAAMGKEMLIKGLSESAWAIADLARGKFASAGAHAKAAAAFDGGAIAAGVVAGQLGYGHSSGGGAATSGGPIVSGRQSQQPSEPATINVYVGAEWGSMSAQDQSGAINRAIQLGKRGSRSIRRH